MDLTLEKMLVDFNYLQSMKRRNLLVYGVLFLMGCMAKQKLENEPVISSIPIIPKTLRFAVTDAVAVGELEEKYEPFRQVLSQVLGTHIEFFPVDNYFKAAAALNSHEVDLVWAGPSEYVVIKARSNAIPMIGIKRVDYYTVIVVRKDRGIKSLTDLKGKTIDFEHNGSTSTHIGGIKLLMDSGLNPQTDFQSIMSEDDSLMPLIKNMADACSRNPYRYQAALEKDNLSKANFPIIAEGQPLPNDILIVGSHIQLEVINYIRQLMLENQNKLIEAILSVKALQNKFQGSTLTPAKDDDYDMIRDVYRAMGQGVFL
ncbi:PhnD/SsuA/transferrin family substrate-binding protein [Crocosphaera subtropica]|nr:PhnD/SsuA/transferrin family substrate-binding protein [Crocosphaera subtropica]